MAVVAARGNAVGEHGENVTGHGRPANIARVNGKVEEGARRAPRDLGVDVRCHDETHARGPVCDSCEEQEAAVAGAEGAQCSFSAEWAASPGLRPRKLREAVHVHVVAAGERS